VCPPSIPASSKTLATRLRQNPVIEETFDVPDQEKYSASARAAKPA
jgi:hypothetical protein